MENLARELVECGLQARIADQCARLYVRLGKLADKLEPAEAELELARRAAVFERLVAIAGDGMYVKLLAAGLATDTTNDLGAFFVTLMRCACDRQFATIRLAPDGKAFDNWNEMTAWKRHVARSLS